MTKTMFDAAFLPSPAPTLFDVAAGYVYEVHGEAANIWTTTDWHRAAAVCRYLLPIATCWTPFGDGAGDAHRAVAAWETVLRALGFKPRPCAFALDMELRVATQPGATGYADAWRSGMRSLGYQDIVYSSSSGGHALGTGPLWLGPPAQPGQAWSNGPVLIAQQHYLGTIDTNTATNDVQFYDTATTTTPQPPQGGVAKGAAMIARTSTGRGYWIVDSTGAVFAYGDAKYHGGANAKPLNAPIVGIASTPSDGGYWLLGKDGGVFAFGDAAFYGAPVGAVH